MQQSPRILLVEDDDGLANVYVMRLQAEGFDVRRVANGEDALAAAISFQPDLVLARCHDAKSQWLRCARHST